MTRKEARTIKFAITLASFYLVVVFVLRCYSSTYDFAMQEWEEIGGSIRSVTQISLEDFRKARPPVSDVFVISLEEKMFHIFEQRNFDMSEGLYEEEDNRTVVHTSLEWYKAFNGMDQKLLDEWAKITKLPKINATDYVDMESKKKKEMYISPHTVGCYLSHWGVLERARQRWNRKKQQQKQRKQKQKQKQQPETPKGGLPDMLFIFEDDAHCVTNLIDRVWKVVKRLPKDWDILYIGGKPMSYYTNKTLYQLTHENASEVVDIPRPSNQELMEGMCRGDFGSSHSGPFAPGTSRNDSIDATLGSSLSMDPPYWQTKWMLNTNAYVVNPKRIQRVLRVLSGPFPEYRPVDVQLSYDIHREFMDPRGNNLDGPNAPLKAYMTPRVYCDQEALRSINNRIQPSDWQGWHWLPWQTFAGGYPESKAYVWGRMADRKTCEGIWNASHSTS